MAQSSTVLPLTGKSGKQYSFHVHPIGTECKDESGIYVFTKRTLTGTNGTHIPIYIGMADSFVKRFYAHHKEDAIIKAGANCICLMQVPNTNDRTVIEKDLLANYNCCCNQVNN